jgi:hypothetical protein
METFEKYMERHKLEVDIGWVERLSDYVKNGEPTNPYL